MPCSAATADVAAPLPRVAAAAPAAPVAAVPLVPQLLPGDVPDFTGHDELVEQMSRQLLPDPAGAPAVGVPIVAVSGKAGVGKTTLAVHVGHELAAEFPDGQPFGKLNGLSTEPVSAQHGPVRVLRPLRIPRSGL